MRSRNATTLPYHRVLIFHLIWEGSGGVTRNVCDSSTLSNGSIHMNAQSLGVRPEAK